MREWGGAAGYLGDRKDLGLTKDHKTEEDELWACPLSLGYGEQRE